MQPKTSKAQAMRMEATPSETESSAHPSGPGASQTLMVFQAA